MKKKLRKFIKIFIISFDIVMSLIYFSALYVYIDKGVAISDDEYYKSEEYKNQSLTLEEYTQKQKESSHQIALLASLSWIALISFSIVILLFGFKDKEECSNDKANNLNEACLDDNIKKYKVSGRHGKVYDMTARQFYMRILEDSKSDYGWIASASSIVSKIREPSFEEEYRVKIKTLILNCFANLQLEKEQNFSSHSKEDEEAVYYCYNSLDSCLNEALTAKEKYLKSFISSIVKYTDDSVRLVFYIGPEYSEFCKNWEEAKFLELKDKKIDFRRLYKKLNLDFESSLKEAEDKGILKEQVIINYLGNHECGNLTSKLLD